MFNTPTRKGFSVVPRVPNLQEEDKPMAIVKQMVHGTVAHDDADADNPVKIGSRAIDYAPDSEGEQGPADVSADDRANSSVNLKGELIEGVKSEYNTLTAINTTYDADPTTAVSASIDCWQYRQATLSFEIDVANTPTLITFDVEISMDGTNYTKLMNDFLGDLSYDDIAVGSGIEESLNFPIACRKIRVRVSCTGTGAVNTFTVANAALFLRN